jgi:hypothetical protein
MLATPDQQISPGGQFPHAETRLDETAPYRCISSATRFRMR